MSKIKWQTPEFDYHHKDVSWYWMVIILSIFIAGIALWQKNLFFVIFIAVASAMIVVWGQRRPRIIEFRLDKNNLRINKKQHKISDFEGFFVSDDLLVLKHKGRFSSYLKIKINGDKRREIHDLLEKMLEIIEYEESLIDIIIKRIRF